MGHVSRQMGKPLGDYRLVKKNKHFHAVKFAFEYCLNMCKHKKKEKDGLWLRNMCLQKICEGELLQMSVLHL